MHELPVVQIGNAMSTSVKRQSVTATLERSTYCAHRGKSITVVVKRPTTSTECKEIFISTNADRYLPRGRKSRESTCNECFVVQYIQQEQQQQTIAHSVTCCVELNSFSKTSIAIWGLFSTRSEKTQQQAHLSSLRTV